MSGPEAIYADMVSGDPGQLADAAADLKKAMSDVSDSTELVKLAADKPDWSSPSARTRFNMNAWATRATAEMAFIRLNRAALAVRKVAADYPQMTSDAAEVIARWRKATAEPIDGFQLLLVRFAAIAALLEVRQQFGTQIDAAIAFLDSEDLTPDQQDWLEHGLSKSMVHDLEHPGERGPVIPGTLATGDDKGGWTPQGLGYDPATQQLLQTAYSGKDSQLALIDPETGEQTGLVNLGEGYDDQGGALGVPDHGGGVAVRGDSVFVMSSSNPPLMFEYSMKDIRGAAPGATVPTHGTPAEMPDGASAYSTIDGDNLYVGSFTEDADEPGRLWTYHWDSRTHSWQSSGDPVPTPPQTQGVTVRGGDVIFSSSWGRGEQGSLKSYDLASVLANSSDDMPTPRGTVDLPNMAEGVMATPDGVLTTFESGSLSYSKPSAGTDLHDLWAAMNMTVTPYAALGLDGGIDVDPPTLKQASSMFDQAEQGLASSESTISSVELPGDSLGSVPQGARFATTLTQHCDTTASWLSKGQLAAGVTASGLVTSAAEYADSDSAIGGIFDRLNPWGD